MSAGTSPALGTAPATATVAQRAVRGGVWLVALSTVGMVASLAGNIVLARLLLPEHFGSFALALAVVEMIYVVGGWSFASGLVHSPEERPGLFPTGLTLSLGLGSTFFVLSIPAAWCLTRVYPLKVCTSIVMIMAVRIIYLTSYCYSACLERELRYRDIAVVQVAANVVAFGTGVLCASRGLGLWSLIARDAAAGAGTLAGMRVCAGRRMRPGFDRREAAFLLRFGSKMLLSRLGETVFHRLDKLVVGTLVGVGALGLYSQAYLLAETGNRFAGPLAVQVPFGTYARLQHSRAHLSRGYELVNYFLVRMLAFGAVVLALFPRDVLVVLLGWPWAEGAPLLRWLALYACLLPVFDHIRVLLVATGAVWEVVRIRIAQLILFVPVLWFGVKAYGAVGAAVAVDVAMVVGLVYGGSRLRRILDVRWRGLLAPPVLAAACAGGAARWFLSGRSLQEPVARLAAGCGITAGVYVAVLFLLEGRLALGRMRWLRAAWRGGSMETVPCAQRG